VDNHTPEQIEKMRAALCRRDSKILKESDIFTLAYYGCIGYNRMPIEKIVKHYESWRNKKRN
tara:strand:+ start:222 stop:407 length:186 start_codon:yes stop_codon:yes gene_type:complete